ncbi:uncharacterized protein LOC141915311 [Tubulanus polymorphus]|uniref:uncharacterized protein LOC141915311 n=1 Tax=Tubulanus polymorphus TaxID=672921 RepID=UPI003DA3B9BA
MVALAVCDSGILVMHLLAWINCLTSELLAGKIYILFASQFECSFMEYLYDAAITVEPAFICTLTFERLVVIYSPIKGKTITTARTAKIMIVFIVIFSFLLSSFLPYYLTYSHELGCHHIDEFSRIVDYLRGVIVFMYIPILLVFVFNLLIIVSLKRAGKSVATNTKSTANSAKITQTILAISFTFAICLLPMASMIAITSVRPDWQETLAIPLELSKMIYTINNAINFYIYACTGKEIREAVVVLFTKTKDV